MENESLGTYLSSNDIKNIVSTYNNSKPKEPEKEEVSKLENKEEITETKLEKPVVKTSDEKSDPEKLELEESKNDSVIENLKKELSSKEKALSDTKKTYQTVNQKHVLAQKKFKNALEQIKETLLNYENTVLEEEEFNNAINVLKSVYEFTDEELETKEAEKKEETPKEKVLLDKLTQEFNIFKKYNKSDEHDKNFDAFFKSYHLLDANEKQSVKEYLEEADSNDAIDKILLMGKDYRELFESGLNQHKNIFAYVNDLHAQISKLNEEINKSKKSVDTKSEEEDNKQIKSRASFSEKDVGYNKSTLRLINMFK